MDNDTTKKIGAWFSDISNLTALTAIAAIIATIIIAAALKQQPSRLIILAALSVLVLVVLLKYADISRFGEKIQSYGDVPALGLAKGSVRALLSFGFLVGLGLFIYYSLAIKGKPNMQIFTALISIISAVVGFYFGSKAAIAGQNTAAPAAPNISAMEPGSGKVGSEVQITNLAGGGFKPGARVSLVLGTDKIFAENVSVIAPNKIKCVFKLSQTVKAGKWDVVVANPDGQQGILDDGFELDS
jgi:hypothetical protein